MQTPSRVATAAAALGGLGALLALLGPGLIQLGALVPMAGFQVFMLAPLLGVAALLLGLLGLWLTRAAAGRAGRGRAVLGLGLGAALVALVAASAGPAGGLPPVNDITTDPDDPPQFKAAPELEANRGRDFAYAGGELARQTRQAYPDLEPIALAAPPDETFARAEAAVRALGWTILHGDARAGALEASDTTRIFRFVDDVSIRVRPAGSGSRVDVRSKSRDGRGDLGANAARIRAFREQLLASRS